MMIAYHEHSKTNNYKKEIDFLGLFMHIKEMKVALITYPLKIFYKYLKPSIATKRSAADDINEHIHLSV